MSIKIVFLLFACCTLVLSHSVDSRERRLHRQRQSSEKRNRNIDDDCRRDVISRDDANNDDDLRRDDTSNDVTSNDDNSNDDSEDSEDSESSESRKKRDTESDSRDQLRKLESRWGNAINKTVQEERNALSDASKNMRNLTAQGIQFGAKLTKDAWDLATFIPKFGRNLISDDESSNE